MHLNMKILRTTIPENNAEVNTCFFFFFCACVYLPWVSNKCRLIEMCCVGDLISSSAFVMTFLYEGSNQTKPFQKQSE